MSHSESELPTYWLYGAESWKHVLRDVPIDEVPRE